MLDFGRLRSMAGFAAGIAGPPPSKSRRSCRITHRNHCRIHASHEFSIPCRYIQKWFHTWPAEAGAAAALGWDVVLPAGTSSPSRSSISPPPAAGAFGAANDDAAGSRGAGMSLSPTSPSFFFCSERGSIGSHVP